VRAVSHSCCIAVIQDVEGLHAYVEGERLAMQDQGADEQVMTSGEENGQDALASLQQQLEEERHKTEEYRRTL
jgi:hypothetical protein